MNRESMNRIISFLNVNVIMLDGLGKLGNLSLLNCVDAQIKCDFLSPRPSVFKEEYSIILTFTEHNSDQARSEAIANNCPQWTYGSHDVPKALFKNISKILMDVFNNHPGTFDFRAEGPTLSLTTDLCDDYYYFQFIIK